MANYLLLRAGGNLLLQAGGKLLLRDTPVTVTGGGGVLLDLGKRRYPKGLSHIRTSEVGGETLMAAGTREKADSLRQLIEQQQRTADDEQALILILSHLA